MRAFHLHKNIELPEQFSSLVYRLDHETFVTKEHSFSFEDYLRNSGITFDVTTHEKIVLLDLNKTLAEHCVWNWKTGWYDVDKDEYSLELINVLESLGYFVIIVTARPEIYKEATLTKLLSEHPDFPLMGYVCKNGKSDRFVKISVFKKAYAEELLKFVEPTDLVCVESNAETRKEYKSLGIPVIKPREAFLNEYRAVTG
jgi:hypothetical protein